MHAKSFVIASVAFLIAFVAGLTSYSIVSAYDVKGAKWSGYSASYDVSWLPTQMSSPTTKGANAWTNSPVSAWTYNKVTSSDNDVTMGSIDGANGALAVTSTYVSGTTIIGFDFKYDSGENWYTGTGTPASNQYDAWSTATHEFGHALGLAHTQSAFCPLNTYASAMCANQYAGTTWKRILPQL